MSKVNKATKLKELKLEYPEVKAWVYEHDIWSPNRMPDNTWSYPKSSNKTKRPSYYYLVQRIMSEVGTSEMNNNQKQRLSSLCYIREELYEMGEIVPSIASLITYANDLTFPAPKIGNKKTGKIGNVQIFEPKRMQLKKAIAKRK
jgi:hypothetical protein